MMQREIKQELVEKIAHDIATWHAGEMMIVLGNATRFAHGDGDISTAKDAANSTEQSAKRKATKIVDLILATQEAGKVV